jgi:transposase
VDLHTRQQTVAMLNVETGKIVEKTLQHEGESVREFYSTLAGPTRVGIEATGSMQWFLELMEELGIDCQVGHPAKIRAAEPRKQKHDRRDASLVLQLLVENRFPSIWMPSREQRDVRSLILYRHQWVRIRTRVHCCADIRLDSLRSALPSSLIIRVARSRTSGGRERALLAIVSR